MRICYTHYRGRPNEPDGPVYPWQHGKSILILVFVSSAAFRLLSDITCLLQIRSAQHSRRARICYTHYHNRPNGPDGPVYLWQHGKNIPILAFGPSAAFRLLSDPFAVCRHIRELPSAISPALDARLACCCPLKHKAVTATG